MKLKDDLERGTLYVDAFSAPGGQTRVPKDVKIMIDGKECRGICTVKGMGSDRIIFTVVVDEKGQIAENVPDFKESLGKVFDMQIVDKEDSIAFVAALDKIEEGRIGHKALRHGYFEIQGERAPLDFEPPTVQLPVAPFPEAK